MGAGGSVRRSAASMRTEVERLRERELNREEELEKQRESEELRAEASITVLRSDKHELAEQLREAKSSLREQSEGWRKEKNKTLALTYSDLPLSLLAGCQPSGLTTGDASLSKRFPMVTIAQCDVVGFAALSTRLQPQEVINVIDRLHSIIDEAFDNKDIFIMERTSDGCIAASGIVETIHPEKEERDNGTTSPWSMTDSSYGSELDLDFSETSGGHPRDTRHELAKPEQALDTGKPPSYYASLIASAALQLMASTPRVQVPRSYNKQLQLRIALHSGLCSGGVIGLRTSGGTARTPHYKLFGPTLKHTSNLCSTGLALQIRVSKQCRDLLLKASSADDRGKYLFERCPDYVKWTSRKTVESYWLVGREGVSLKLPSLDLAVPLSQYEDIEV